MDRPLSDRKHREPVVSAACWEVRAWQQPARREPDEQGWRSLAWCPSHDDAAAIARALVVGSSHPFEFVEVWGPGEEQGGRTHVCERFPEPSADERRAMWLRAASEHYTDGQDLIGSSG